MTMTNFGRTKTKNGTKIKLCKEAANALKSKKAIPSDDRLLRMVNGYSVNDVPSSATLRWMAVQILGSYGYEFEV